MDEKDRNDWLTGFNDLANKRLNEQPEVRSLFPTIEEWFSSQHSNSVETIDSPIQKAVACLSTEVIFSMPDELRELFDFRHAQDEEKLVEWIQRILNIGRAFQESLDWGEFSDL